MENPNPNPNSQPVLALSRTVAVVHVEIEHRDPGQPVRALRVARGGGRGGEQAEAHRAGAERVVAGRAHGAKADRGPLAGRARGGDRVHERGRRTHGGQGGGVGRAGRVRRGRLDDGRAPPLCFEQRALGLQAARVAEVVHGRQQRLGRGLKGERREERRAQGREARRGERGVDRGAAWKEQGGPRPRPGRRRPPPPTPPTPLNAHGRRTRRAQPCRARAPATTRARPGARSPPRRRRSQAGERVGGMAGARAAATRAAACRVGVRWRGPVTPHTIAAAPPPQRSPTPGSMPTTAARGAGRRPAPGAGRGRGAAARPARPGRGGGRSPAPGGRGAGRGAVAAPAKPRPRPTAPAKAPPPPPAPAVDASREAHKLFDEVVITVTYVREGGGIEAARGQGWQRRRLLSLLPPFSSGKGGRGEITKADAGRVVPNFKFKKDGRSTKTIFLAARDPAPGADGGAVLLRADASVPDLLHLHARATYKAASGGNGDATRGSAAPRTGVAARLAAAGAGGPGPAPRTPPLVLPVPLGTVVKRAKGGALLGELLRPGDTVCVARGGAGGAGAVAPTAGARSRARAVDDPDLVADDDWRADAEGGEGESVAVSLLLRVVADVGIVGLPNAGKSSLLAALTAATPEVAAYPFTTLMPNLGVLAAGGGEGESEFGDADAPPPPVLADLPGLIEGAHRGRGLGRMFLRHLRRARVVLHVVDGSAGEEAGGDEGRSGGARARAPTPRPLSLSPSADPAADYATVRRELALYNPEYVDRPHVVALNKEDLVDGGGGGVGGDGGGGAPPSVSAAAAAAVAAAAEGESMGTPPAAVVATSAATGAGVAALAAALAAALRACDDASPTPPRRKVSPRDREARVARARAAAGSEDGVW